MEHMEHKHKDKDAGPYWGWWLLAIAALGACALAVAYWIGWSPSGPDDNAAAKMGQMGDFFGGMLNPLVSALTLFVAISVWQLQKKELKATQKALDEQAKTAEQQRQEQRFFDLLNVYQRTVGSITQTEDKSSTGDSVAFLTSNGKQAISVWFKRSSLSKTALGAIDIIQEKENVKKLWGKHDAQGTFDHYFRVIHHILSEAETLLSDQHIRYIELFRAQLSRSELIILGFNLWLDEEGQNMIPLVEKYGLLKHLPIGHLRTELEKLYPLAFGASRAAENAQPQ